MPFHIVPDTWDGSFWFLLISFTLICLAVSVAAKNDCVKFLSRFAFCSSFLFYAGLLSFYLGFYALAEIQIFRFPDTFLPFAVSVLSLYYLNAAWRRYVPSFRHGKTVHSAVIILILAALLIFRVLPRAPAFWDDWGGAVYHHIRTQTDADDLFLVNPNDAYIWAEGERAAFVVIKYFPISAGRAQVQWYERLVEINGGEPAAATYSYNRREIADNYRRMTQAKVCRLVVRYGIDYFLISATARVSATRVSEDFSFPVVYRDDAHFLYRTKNQCG